MSKPPEEISLLEVFEATIGPIKLVDCVGDAEDCSNTELCQCRVLWKLLNYRITDVLAEYSLNDLIDVEGIRKMTEELERIKLHQRGDGSRVSRGSAGGG